MDSIHLLHNAERFAVGHIRAFAHSLFYGLFAGPYLVFIAADLFWLVISGCHFPFFIIDCDGLEIIDVFHNQKALCPVNDSLSVGKGAEGTVQHRHLPIRIANGSCCSVRPLPCLS